MKQRLTKKSSIFFAIFTTVILFAFSSSHPTTGTGGYTGAPNDSVCTTCHTPGGNLDGTIEVTGLPANVLANTTYPLTVTITDTSTGGAAVRSGFQMVSLKANLANAGTFAPASGETNAVTKTIAGKSYIGHEPAKNFGAGNIVTFEVEWTAPASATGDITLYAASMIGSGGNGNSNDKFVATNITTEIGTGGVPLSATFSNVTDVLCSDSDDGSATVDASGGSGGYSYMWDNGETNATAVMLAQGDHDVTITDDSNETITETVTIGAPQPIILNVISTTDATCNGTNTGTSEITATGGTPGYFYNWGGGINGAIQNNLAAGLYTVTATDLNGCEETLEVTINEPEPIIINTTNITEPLCSGDSNGSISVEAIGGNGGFSYNWLTGGIGIADGGTLSSIPMGEYLVEVFDSEGCSNEIEITLSEPDATSSTIASTDVNCFGSMDGTATATAVGGVGNYNYEWSNGGSGATQLDLAIGTYFVTATDANGCESTANVEISGPAEELVAGITPTSIPNCGNSDGTLSAFANGGTPDYQYLWNDGSTSAVLDGIASGIYAVTVTDINSCTSAIEFTLTDNDGVLLAANDVINNICSGEANGSATVSASGGSGDYSYNWSNGGTNATETGLPSGTYSITVTDENECTGEIFIDITEPDAAVANEIITHISCNGAEDGTITIAPTGGTGDLSVLWNIGSTENTINDLVPGLYSVVITDNNDCMTEIEFVIEEPEEITVTDIITVLPQCPGDSSGIIMIQATGGMGILTLEWDNGIMGTEIIDISAGDYILSIFDENGCTKNFSFTLDDPQAITASSTIIEPTCSDSSDGILSVQASGGTGEFSYLWEDGSTDSLLVDITSGTYVVSITDQNNCLFTQTLTLSAPPAIDANLITTNETENGAEDGTATADPQNGINPYSFLWSNGDTTSMISDLAPGMYSVVITDSIGCTIQETFNISSGDCAVMAVPTITNITCFGLTDGSISVELTGMVEPITFDWSTESTEPEIIDLAVGTYSVIITDANNCQIQLTDIEITEPSEIVASDAIITSESGSGASDGRIEVDFSGGTGDLIINYTDGNGNPINITSFNDLPTGTYAAVIIDENGCMQTFGPYIVDVVSSVTEEKVKAVFYPIPARNILTIEVSEQLITLPQVFTATGQNIEVSMSSENKLYYLDVSQLSTGFYYVKLETENGSELKKIIVGR